MNDKDKPKQREKLPSQAEGAKEPEKLTEDYPKPSKAEGNREDVEETLRAEEKKKKS